MAMGMKKKNDLLVKHLKSRNNYDKLDGEIRKVLEFKLKPLKSSIYTISSRFKDDERLIEKIEQENKKRKKKRKKNKNICLIDDKNYPSVIHDILGIRIVCLRLSDVKKNLNYMESLKKEKKLKFTKPKIKKTFIIPVNPGEIKSNMIKGMDIQYNGYSSIHYIVQLGKIANPSPDIKFLYAEIQVRTIFEETWGEIHHRYQYEPIKSKIKLPNYINRGFYPISAYLQSAALQSEYLCADVEPILISKNKERIANKLKQKGVKKEPRPLAIKHAIEQTFKVVLSDAVFSYIQDQLRKFSILTMKDLKNTILKEELINDFTKIYDEEIGRKPFQSPVEKDIDVINAIDFALTYIRKSIDYAEESLREVLRKRINIK